MLLMVRVLVLLIEVDVVSGEVVVMLVGLLSMWCILMVVDLIGLIRKFLFVVGVVGVKLSLKLLMVLLLLMLCIRLLDSWVSL